MTDVTHQQQSRLKDLIAKGKEQGYLTYSEVNDHLPQDISDPDQVEDIIQMINDMGIQVFESAPDADELLMAEGDSSADDIAAAEARYAELRARFGDSVGLVHGRLAAKDKDRVMAAFASGAAVAAPHAGGDRRGGGGRGHGRHRGSRDAPAAARRSR